MSLPKCIILLSLLAIVTSCSVKKIKDIDFKAPQVKEQPVPKLNLFALRKRTDSLQPVLVFIYGGNWNSGRKGLYNYVGRNFARHEVTVVIPDYTKSPAASYDDMAHQIAASIKWTLAHIEDYGGDPNQIYITGHSAGGHLGALAVMNDKYEIDASLIKGIILNDAAGLDMYSYFHENPPTDKDNYLATWTAQPQTWKDASPYYFIDGSTPEMKIYVGSKTYPSIIAGNERFLKELQKYQPEATATYLDKKHAAMVTQLFFPWNDRIDEMVKFITD